MGNYMIQIDVVISAEQNVQSKVYAALQSELSGRLSGFEANVRIRKGPSSSLSVSGTRNDSERDEILSIIQSVWEDDSWLPE